MLNNSVHKFRPLLAILASTTDAVHTSANSVNTDNLTKPAERNSHIKICPPDSCTGNKKKFDNFIHSLMMNFSVDISHFTNDLHSDKNCIIYTLFYMKTGKASKWAQLYDKKLTDLDLSFLTWKEFEIDLHAKFADSNLKATAQHKIKTLYIDNICNDFILTFKIYEVDMQYNDKALLEYFKSGFSYALCKQIATNGNLAVLQLWKKKALILDCE